MIRALRLARRPPLPTSPNPPVGAVLVRAGQVVGEGFHRGSGHPHAEAVAIAQAGPLAKGATLYVTLEPCAHHGRTPPCTDAISKAGISRVVVATLDRNPIVNGRGVRHLRRAGIAVTVGILEQQALFLLSPFFKFITRKLPFVTLKMAMTADGKIATASGDSRWITGLEARKWVHRLRRQSDAILVGVGTVLLDDPELTVRLVPSYGYQPIRVVADTYARTPPEAKILKGGKGRVIIAVGPDAPSDRTVALEKAGAEVWVLPYSQGQQGVDLLSLNRRLASENVMNLLVEGGSRLAGSLMDEGLIDRIAFFIAPIMIGGRNAIPVVGGQGRTDLCSAITLKNPIVRKIGSDFLLLADLT